MNRTPEKPRTRVFLSYASSDKQSAKVIAKALLDGGISTWLDEWEIRVGDSFIQKIETAATSADYVLLLLSPAAVGSDWVEKEINLGLSKELSERAIRLIPVMVADCEIPSALRDRQWLDLRANKRQAGLRMLVEQLSIAPSIRFEKLTPQVFERLVGDLLIEFGFSVKAQRANGPDSGFDFSAVYTSYDPFGAERSETWLVEVKFHSHSRLSIRALHEAIGLLAGWQKGAKALLVTSGSITSEARGFLGDSAYADRVRVIDGLELSTLLTRYPSLVARYFGGESGA
jgi:hypothetical protein